MATESVTKGNLILKTWRLLNKSLLNNFRYITKKSFEAAFRVTQLLLHGCLIAEPLSELMAF